MSLIVKVYTLTAKVCLNVHTVELEDTVTDIDMTSDICKIHILGSMKE